MHSKKFYSALKFYSFLFFFFLILYNSISYPATQIPGGTISKDSTWTLASSPFIIKGDLTISSAGKLTIQPGVVVKFESNRRIFSTGILTARGSATDKIVFTSSKDNSYGGSTDGTGSPLKGDWGYIQISNSGSVLEQCLIRFGGAYGNYGSVDIESCKPVIRNSTVEESASYGIYGINLPVGFVLESDSIRNCVSYGINFNNTDNSSEIKNNVITDCNLGGIALNNAGRINVTNNKIKVNGYPFLQWNTSFPVYSGNVVLGSAKKIAVSGTISGEIIFQSNFTGIWSNVQGENFVYVVTGDLMIANSSQYGASALIIEPGVIVKFDSNRKLIANGFLIAQGSAANKIVFTSSKDDLYGGDSDGSPAIAAKGDWGYIQLNNGSSILDQCKFRYGGSLANSGMVGIESSKPIIKNCTIEESAYDGLNGSNLPAGASFENIIIKKCSRYGIRLVNSPSITLNNILVSGSVNGIYLDNSSPVITNAGVSNSTIGIQFIGDSNPNISKCEIVSNTIGIYGSGRNKTSNPLPVINYNNFEKNAAFNIMLGEYKNPTLINVDAKNNWYETTDTNQILYKLFFQRNEPSGPNLTWSPFLTKKISSTDSLFSTADINHDAEINGADLALLGSSFGYSAGNQFYNLFADINSSGRVDGFDLAFLGVNFGKSGGLITNLNKKTASNASQVLSVSTDFYTSKPGDTCFVNLYLSGFEQPFAFSSELKTNPDVLKILSFNEGGLLSNNFSSPVSLLNNFVSGSYFVGASKLEQVFDNSNRDSLLLKVKVIKKADYAEQNIFTFTNPSIMNNKGEWFESVKIAYNNLTGVKNPEINPSDFMLLQNYPNPFNPETTISFNLPKESSVQLILYNLLGEKVKDLISSNMTTGFHSYVLNGKNLASGIYFYVLKTNENVSIKKLILLK